MTQSSPTSSVLEVVPRHRMYTANQPLCLGGMIYMWNRYFNVGHMVHMGEAQFTKGGHQSRITVLGYDGHHQWLIFPIKDRFQQSIDRCVLHEPEHAFKKAMATLNALYSRQAHFKKRRDDLFGLFHVLLGDLYPQPLTLEEFNLAMFQWVKEQVGLDVIEYDSSVIVPDRPTDPSEWVAEMGSAIDCDLYLGGGTAQQAYLRQEHFDEREMSFCAQSFKMKPYGRGQTINEDATISILDPLFVGGKDLVQELCAGPALA